MANAVPPAGAERGTAGLSCDADRKSNSVSGQRIVVLRGVWERCSVRKSSVAVLRTKSALPQASLKTVLKASASTSLRISTVFAIPSRTRLMVVEAGT